MTKATINYNEAPTPVLLAALHVATAMARSGLTTFHVAHELRIDEEHAQELINRTPSGAFTYTKHEGFHYQKAPEIIRHMVLQSFIDDVQRTNRPEDIAPLYGLRPFSIANWRRNYRQLTESKELLNINAWVKSLTK